MAGQEKTPARVGKVVQQYPKAVEWLQKQIKTYES
jgi:hypothetical protein